MEKLKKATTKSTKAKTANEVTEDVMEYMFRFVICLL